MDEFFCSSFLNYNYIEEIVLLFKYKDYVNIFGNINLFFLNCLKIKFSDYFVHLTLT